MADQISQSQEEIQVPDVDALSAGITDFVTTTDHPTGQVEEVDGKSLSLIPTVADVITGEVNLVEKDEVKEESSSSSSFSIPVGIGCNSESNVTRHCYPSDDEASESEESVKGEEMDVDAETAYQYVMEQQQLLKVENVGLPPGQLEQKEEVEEEQQSEKKPVVVVENNAEPNIKKEKEEENENEGNNDVSESTNNDNESVPNQQEMEMRRTFKIFVSNLPPGMLNPELAELFLKYGEVVECEIFAKNYAFVHMESEESGIKAMEELNGLDIRGCKINVKKSYQATGPKNIMKKSTDMEVGTYKIYIGNMIDDVTKEYVTNMLEPYGRIVEIEIFRHNSAFVHMETEAGAKKAMVELNGKPLPDVEKPMLVTDSKNPEGPSLSIIKLKVKNVATTVSAETLRNLFIPYGLVLKVKIFPNNDATRSAIVHLEQYGNIRSAIKELSGKEVEGSTLQVEPFFEPVKIAPTPVVNSFPNPVKPLLKQSFPPIRPPSRQFGHEYARIPRNFNQQHHDYNYHQPQSYMPHAHSRGGPPMGIRRLIPMPSKAELGRYPGRASGRPPPLINQHNYPPAFQHEEYNDYDNYEHGYYDDAQNADYNEYNDDSNYFTSDSSSYDNNMHYEAPPSKLPRMKKGRNSRMPGGGSAQQWGYDNEGGQQRKSNNKKKDLFPDFPSPESFPTGRPPSLMSVQVNSNSDDCDWSADLPLSSFSQFSNDQDFAADDGNPSAATTTTTPTSPLNAVPFDYSHLGNKLVNNIPKEMASRLRNPNAQVYYNQDGKLKIRGNRGGKSGKGKGKSRRPGLGSTLQQKKTANQSGNLESVGISQIPTIASASRVLPDHTATASTASTTPSYFKPSWPSSNNNNTKKIGGKPTTWKEIKEAEEEQKRQYTDYLKQKPWLYQAIPGTVKRVDK